MSPCWSPCGTTSASDTNTRLYERWRLTAESTSGWRLMVGVFRDVEHADSFLETFLVMSWAEHLRQHERFTRGDADVEARVRRHVEGEPFVEHFVGANAISTTANTNNRTIMTENDRLCFNLVDDSIPKDDCGVADANRYLPFESVGLMIEGSMNAVHVTRAPGAGQRHAVWTPPRMSSELTSRRSISSIDDATEAAVPLGTSHAWREVINRATRVAATDAITCLQGQSGTGKEVVARFIHRRSPRRHGPFIAINCAALPDQLLESELFGFERGAFTGAQQPEVWPIEMAAGGVLFLDEVTEMTPAAQANSCACSRIVNSCGWVARGRFASTCASSLRPIATCRMQSSVGNSVSTFSTV